MCGEVGGGKGGEEPRVGEDFGDLERGLTVMSFVTLTTSIFRGLLGERNFVVSCFDFGGEGANVLVVE